MVPIRTFKSQLSGTRAASADVKLSVGNDPGLGDEPVLFVSYPSPSADPASRDVWCDAETTDWSSCSAISFHIKPERPLKLSVSFFDRNRVVYTSWVDLEGNVWQPVTLSLRAVRPNPYFQPPGAKIGAPIDVSEVTGVAFAPHDQSSGRLSISKLVAVE